MAMTSEATYKSVTFWKFSILRITGLRYEDGERGLDHVRLGVFERRKERFLLL